MVERPLIMGTSGEIFDHDESSIPPASFAAWNSLLPVGGSLAEKFHLNGISCNEDASNGGLFLRMSRINHSCLGNCLHEYLPTLKVKILVASRPIAPGEEITFTYKGMGSKDEFRHRRALLRATFKFDCSCEVCLSPLLEAKLAEMLSLDASIFELGGRTRVKEALLAGRRLLALYDELGVSSLLYSRTYYDMFQIAIMRSETVAQGTALIAKAIEHAEIFCAEDKDKLDMYRRFLANSRLHRNYLAATSYR